LKEKDWKEVKYGKSPFSGNRSFREEKKTRLRHHRVKEKNVKYWHCMCQKNCGPSFL
jgi:hypothetical protein